MDIFLDIETIPDQTPGAFDEYLKTAKSEFKVPSRMNKADLIADIKAAGVEVDAKSTVDVLKSFWSGLYADDLSIPIADTEWRRTALTDAGQICVICARCDTGSLEGIDSYCTASIGINEETLLRRFFAAIKLWIDDTHGQKPYFIGHNIQWDLERIMHKAWKHNIDPGFKIPFYGLHGKDYYCTMQAFAGFKKTISQDNLCKFLGIEGKGDINGSMVWDIWQKSPEKVAAYCMHDVETVERIYKRLEFRSWTS